MPLKAQPAWALKHIFTNLAHTLTANLQNTVDTFYQTLFRGWYSPWRSVLAAIIALVFLGLIDYRTTWRNFRQKPVEAVGTDCIAYSYFSDVGSSRFLFIRVLII